MKNYILAILTFISFQINAQTCDSLDSEGVDFGVSIDTLEKLIESNCDKAKLSYAYELLTGYRISKDSIRAIELLNDCKDRNIDCKYELFQVYYEKDLKRAYQLITEIALTNPMKNYWDSIMVVNARLIAADMVERHLGNNYDLSKAATWYILYFEIQNTPNFPKIFEGMIEEMYRVLNLLTKKQLDIAFKEAEVFLGHTPSFQRKMIK